MSEEIYRLWLSSLYELGSRRQNRVLEHFGSARAAFYVPAEMVRTVPGLSDNACRMITASRDLNRMETMLRQMEDRHIVYISRDHKSFPPLLAAIDDPPLGIFYIGELPDPYYKMVGVIGSRRCSEYGLTAARMICKPLGHYPVVVVSGMARGIDSMAHKGMMEGGGKTVAVLGCGVDICYPAENHGLREDIIANGCVLSEYPPGVKPMPAYFPVRNRIISGLCQVLVVVEAAKKSGTLITVSQASDQGREVMAVPGNIVSKLSEGTNALIYDGAAPVTAYQDILSALKISIKTEASARPGNTAVVLAPEEKLVYDSLTFEPVTFDELVIKTNSQAQTIHYLCTLLEVKGYIKKLPGLRYIKNI